MATLAALTVRHAASGQLQHSEDVVIEAEQLQTLAARVRVYGTVFEVRFTFDPPLLAAEPEAD